ncbi:hypothetical protein H8S90_25795 [Olivibacter sp. SDN3]|uniref:hypothetical protein n=1 Tax=Olivibacter sp. SDN3 TaxID=2764720 RepID=UPI0016518EA2|nr:hypothetical protein [Olivibacter sp. SDN3]QNL50054.1 hypothetical protein H8S90_25795 [Olivibacter sp. SDN3]
MFIHQKKILGYTLLLFISLSFPLSISAQTRDQVLELLWKGMGGRQSWEEARYFMFSCETELHDMIPGEHSYIWDRVNNNCRFEGTTNDQQKLTVLFNTKTRAGKVYVNNSVIADSDSSSRWLKPILNAFYSDSFWLFPPKLIEAADVTATNEQELIGSNRYYVVDIKIRRPNFGEFPSKLFIDTNTGRIFQWQAFANDGSVLYNFNTSSFKEVGGGLILPTNFADANSSVNISYPIVSALINVEADKFTKP